MTEDEMVGWHHRLDGREFGWTLGVGDGQGGLACYSSWGCKESDMSERLNCTEEATFEKNKNLVKLDQRSWLSVLLQLHFHGVKWIINF